MNVILVCYKDLNIKTNEYGDVEKYSSYINNPRYFDISRNLTFNLNGVLIQLIISFM